MPAYLSGWPRLRCFAVRDNGVSRNSWLWGHTLNESSIRLPSLREVWRESGVTQPSATPRG